MTVTHGGSGGAGVDTADVVVVGGGAAGLMTAASLVAATGGRLDVVVLEKDTKLGSSAEIGGGTLMAAGTRMQRDAGIEDSPERFAADVARKNGGAGNPALTLALCQESAGTVHWLRDVVGIPLELAPETRRVGPSVMRAHAHPTRSGRPVIGALREWVRGQPGVRFLDRAPGRRLVSRNGGVVGVVAGDDSREWTIMSRFVVLATGGFGADPVMAHSYLGAAGAMPYIGAGGHTGEGLRWGLGLGAATSHLSCYQGHGYHNPATGTRLTPGVVIAGGIVLDLCGHRFAREDQGYSEWADQVFALPDHQAIVLWDGRLHDRYRQVQAMRDAIAAGAVVDGPDIATVARSLGLDAAVVRDTVARYNAGVRDGRDALGRDVTGLPILSPPFHAARTSGAVAQTLGGLRVDVSGRVLSTDGAPIEGLFAAGTTAAGLSGDHSSGYLTGSGLLAAFGLGRIVGRHVAGQLTGELTGDAASPEHKTPLEDR